MTLSSYHKKYAQLSDSDIAKRAQEKENELKEIFRRSSLKTDSEKIRIAVLGCPDCRLVKYHQQTFEKLIDKSVELITFDITTEHLCEAANAVEHDCTLPLPRGPFDITFSHVLLKFIETDKQWLLLKNSYDALKPCGMAIHVMDKEDYESITKQISENYYSVPLMRWEKKLKENNISYIKIPLTSGLALVLLK